MSPTPLSYGEFLPPLGVPPLLPLGVLSWSGLLSLIYLTGDSYGEFLPPLWVPPLLPVGGSLYLWGTSIYHSGVDYPLLLSTTTNHYPDLSDRTLSTLSTSTT